ncbi:hypothetical protein B0T22DRAFT_200959 [Podospora appendiculata]|uniref:Uncharacterized protein n=1 Tax=Podospora appendiculata TaxID=314037 RepID=A0AAE1C9S1_9PEZI|nr:hypothetical protein B0T22DRAFT_200959 [Podospora appendiculata]
MNANHYPESLGMPELLLGGKLPDNEEPPGPIPYCPANRPSYWSGPGDDTTPTVPAGNPSYQQALQQFSATHSPSVDKGLPVPPIRISPPMDTTKSPPPKQPTRRFWSRFSRSSDSINQPDPVPEQNSHTCTDNPDGSAKPSNKIKHLVCIDPRMHSAESHALLHHPGLLKGAEFRDSGVDWAPEVPIELPTKG